MAEPLKAVPLPPPLMGLSEDQGKARQEPGTTRDTANCRPYDPVTGAERLSQRPGWEKFLPGAVKAVGTKVDHIGQVGYQLDLIDFTQLADGALVETLDHMAPSKAEAFSPKTDRKGNVYYIDSESTVVVLNSELEESSRITLPLTGGEQVCRSIEVDERDFVYAAASSPMTLGYGRVWRFSRDAEFERWRLDWTYSTSGTIVLMHYAQGVLYLGMRSKDDSKDESKLAALNVMGDVAFLGWQRSVPDPIRGVGTMPKSGEVLVTAPFNEARSKASDEGKFSVQSIGWVPHDLPNADERIWAWGDAELLDGYSYGDRIEHVPDARYTEPLASDFASTLPIDDTDRYMFWSRVGPYETLRRDSPRYDSAAFGTKPGIRFAGEEGNVLLSRPNVAGENREVAIEKLEKNRGVIPGVKDAVWTHFFVARVTPSKRPQVILAARSGPLKFAIVVNAGHATAFDPTDASTGDEGKIILYDAGGSLTTASTAYQTLSHDWSADGASGNDVNCVLVAITHNGSGTSTLRINGNVVDSFTWGDQRLFASGGLARTFFGGPQLLQGALGETSKLVLSQKGDIESQQDIPGFKITGTGGTNLVEYTDRRTGVQPEDVFSAVASGGAMTFDVDAFDGSIAEWFTVLGDTTTTPHDTPLTTTAGGEMERGEGYLAHKWGIQHLLPGAHSYAAVPPAAVGYTGADFTTADQLALRSREAVLAKFSGSSGKLIWAINRQGGVGLAVAGEDSGNIYTYGPRDPLASPGIGILNPSRLKLIDEGLRVEQGTFSTGVLTFAGQPADGDTVTIDSITYIYKTTLTSPAVSWEVLIGASTSVSRDNLVHTIQQTGDSGVVYSSGPNVYRHNRVRAVRQDTGGTKIDVFALKAGTTEDAVVTTKSSSNLSWGASTLAGGDAKKTWTVTTQHTDSSIDPPDNPGAAWAHVAGAGSAFQVAVDDNGSAYFTKNSTAGAASGIEKYPEVADSDTSGSVTRDWIWSRGYTGAPTVAKYTGLAFPPEHPDYRLQAAKGPMFMYVTLEGPEGATQFGSSVSTQTLQKVRLISEVRSSNDTPRGHKFIAVSGGDVRAFTESGTFVTPTGGTGALDAVSPYIGGFAIFSQYVLFDGSSPAQIYDPVKDRMAKWVATKGEVPPRIVLGTRWRGRATVVSADDPHDVWFAKHGDHYDFDLYPDVPSFEQAFRLSEQHSIGKFPEAITALYELTNNRLLIGGTNVTMLLQGDPAAVGLGQFGQSGFVTVSKKLGIAFGQQAVTEDSDGLVYWVSSEGGVMVWNGKGVERLTLHRIERRIQDMDLTVWKPALAWNERHYGVWLCYLHRRTGGVAQERFFWSKKKGAWNPDDSATVGHQPSCMVEIGADKKEERRLAFGCEDGSIRIEGDDLVSDDGSRIYSYVDMGPYAIGGPTRLGRIASLELALDEAQDGVGYEIYVSDTSTKPDTPVDSGWANRGFNFNYVTGMGAFMWIRLFNGADDERWALEEATARVALAGRRTNRTV